MKGAIVQLFDWSFAAIAREMPRLRAMGFSHVHVSPPQPSNEAVWQWWGRYQPISYDGIGGPLGSEADFLRMAETAADHRIALVVDVVAANPCGPPGMLFGHSLADRGAAYDAGLRYLDGLMRRGARGFRFDGAQRVPPEFLAFIGQHLPGAMLFGEIVAHDVGELAEHAAVPGFRLYDFPLLATMRRAFAPGGDLRALQEPHRNGGALAGDSAVTFVRNHDIERGQADDHGIDEPAYRARFGVGWDEATRSLDAASVRLAHAFLFGRAAGLPYVLCGMNTSPELRTDRHDDPSIVAAIRFRDLCGEGRPEEWLVAMPHLLAWQRGANRLVVIGNGEHPFTLDGIASGLVPGVYRELATSSVLLVERGGRIRSGMAPARWAGFFVAEQTSP